MKKENVQLIFEHARLNVCVCILFFIVYEKKNTCKYIRTKRKRNICLVSLNVQLEEKT